MTAAKTKYGIGISFGNTNSYVGIFKDGKVEIVANDNGIRALPSLVAFNSEEQLIGEHAQAQIGINPSNTILEIKSLLGRGTSEEAVNGYQKKFPFLSLISKDGKPLIEVEFQEQQKIVSPEEIASILLNKVKETVEAYVGEQVKNVVVAVPATWNDSQREALTNAAGRVGLHVVRLINEPTAAMLAYNLDQLADQPAIKNGNQSQTPTTTLEAENTNTTTDGDIESKLNLINQENQEKYTLVFDLGGSNLNLALIGELNGILRTLAAECIPEVGGNVINKRLASHFSMEFQRKYKLEISNRRSMSRLMAGSENTKKILSQNNQASLEVDSLCEGIDFFSSITRARFEDLNMDLFKLYISAVEELLKKCNLNQSRIDHVVLAGGSVRIPAVQNLVAQYFQGKPMIFKNNPEEVIAGGAAAQAFVFATPTQGVAKPPKVEKSGTYKVEVLASSIGYQANNKMIFIFPKWTAFPAKKRFPITTAVDGQKEITLKIYQGESENVKENKFLGKFSIKDLPVSEKGKLKAHVTLDLDPHGNLTVSGKEESQSVLSQLKINVATTHQ
eukprot:TRINITY_DN2836_c0_g1_i3.p1 TRINITY_DN2836_c0_g1~~TRINITY_DN2836_c0_g1_i3.p1  ORF type:complete len:581 (-),score=193.24 TRINITY_DN2836_c0_g1_i3:284-1966(-)